MSSFLGARSGNYSMMMAFLAVPLMLAVGLGVDVTQARKHKAELSDAMDAAVLAGARVLGKGDAAAIAEAHAFFAGNYPHLLDKNGDVDLANPEFSVKEGVLQGVARRSVPTSFMSLASLDKVDVDVKSAATAMGGGMELVMVLDVSGSMKAEIPNLRAAATSLLDELYGPATFLPNTWVGIVPFGGRVNVIEYGQKWTATTPKEKNGPTGTVGTDCKTKSANISYPRLCTNHRGTPDNESAATPSEAVFTEFSGKDYSVCPVNKAMGLTADRSQAQTLVNSLCSGHGTSTEVGMVWGWRMISPKWKGLWGDANLPLSAKDTPGKYVVIMTDGKNHPNQSGDTYSETDANNQLLRECAAMKAEGITIFAVTFNMNGALEALYEQCVSKPEYNFTAESGVELNTVFTTIGATLAKGRLRLVL